MFINKGTIFSSCTKLIEKVDLKNDYLTYYTF